MKVENIKLEKLIPYARNPRKNEGAVASVAASIKEFGFLVPIVLDADDVIIAGHTRCKAAQKLGLDTVPCIRAEGLTPEQVKAFRILDNKVAEKAEWDYELLSLELAELPEFDFDSFDVDFGSMESFEDKNKEIDVEDFADEMEMKLKFTSERYWKVKEALEQISKDPSEAIWILVNK